MNVSIIPFKRIESIKDEWKELSKNQTIFQSYEWNANYLKIKRGGGRNFICIVKDDNEDVVAILPVTAFKRINKTNIIILGKNNYVDYGDIISKSVTKDILAVMVDAIKKKFTNPAIELQGIIENTKLQKLLEAEAVVTAEYKAVAVRIPHDVDEYNAHLTKSTRQNLRTALNRMNTDGLSYRYEIHEGTIDKGFAEKLGNLHRKRNIEKNLTNSSIHNFLRKVKQNFVERYVSVIPVSMRSYNGSWYLIVYLNDIIVGYLYGLRDNKCIRVLQNCFDSDYRRYSPVFRACYDFITKEAIENNLEYLDFTSGDEDYKYKLNGKEMILFSYKIV